MPLLWKDFYYLAGGPAGWVARSFAYGLIASLFVWLIGLLTGRRYDSRDDLQYVGDMLLFLTLFLYLPMECLVLAARVFRSELRDRTWSTLMHLPRSLPEVAYPKLAGGLLGLAPTLLYLGLGAALAPATIEGFAREVLGEVLGCLWLACLLGHALVFVHLATLYSIVSNAWLGALLAIASSFVIGCGQLAAIAILMTMLTIRGGVSGGDEETYLGAILLLSSGVLFAGAAALHYFIAIRLREAAAG
jgi:hypothetical protein